MLSALVSSLRGLAECSSWICRWVKQAGGKLAFAESEPGVEVSPLVSYAGEDLEPLCARRTFRHPFDVFLQVLLCPCTQWLPCAPMLYRCWSSAARVPGTVHA